MGLRDALGTLTFPVSGAFLGFSIPFLIASVHLLEMDKDHGGVGTQTIFFIVLSSLMILFAAVSTLLSLRGFIVPIFPKAFGGRRIKPRNGGALYFAAQAAALLPIMIALSIVAGDFRYLPFEYGWPQVPQYTFDRVERLFNGTEQPPPWWNNDTAKWKVVELSAILNSNQYQQTSDTVNRTELAFFGITSFIIGWILFSLLVISFLAAVVPPRRTFWLEPSAGGITLRWKDRGIALASDSDDEDTDNVGHGAATPVQLSRTSETAV